MSPDEQLSHYKIIERIGYGGMAMVYKAEDTRDGSIVALKILHDQYSADHGIIKRFNREADIFYHLKHPNIVPIIDHGQADGKFYIVMTHMAGGTLFERFGYQQEVTSDFTQQVLMQVASALDFAHAQGVIHRDLKLDNVLLDDHETAYLTDFGIAFLVDATRLTAHQTIAGTPLYMSPEQALGMDVTTRSDVYSLAVMAYLMLTGYHPFTGRDPYTIVNQHISQKPPLPTSVNEQLPPTVDPVILRGLEKEPKKRYAKASDFVNDLVRSLDYDMERTQTLIRLDALNPQALKTIDEDKTTVLGAAPPSQSTSPAAKNTNRFLILGGGLVIVVLIGFVFALLNNNSAESFAIAQTQARREVELDMTSTALVAVESGTISKPDGALLKSSPERDSEDLGVVPFGEPINLIGRSGPGDFIEIETQDGLTGFIKSDQLSTTENLMELPITHQRDNNSNPPATRDVTCPVDLTVAPFGYIIDEDGVDLLARPQHDARVLMVIPEDEQVKMLSRDQRTSFIEVEINDEDKTIGFVQDGDLRSEIDLWCLAVRD